MSQKADVLILGCGIAGLSAALALARDKSKSIAIVTRACDPMESSTAYAQGGIATCGLDDSAESFVHDIVEAGGGLSLPQAARLLVERGAELVERILINKARVPFSKDEKGNLAYAKEGAHHVARILHAQDATGKAIQTALLRQLSAHKNIRLQTEWTAVDLITTPHHSTDALAVYQFPICRGAYVLNRSTGDVHRMLAQTTILATGGYGRVFRYTTNPPGARGDGLAMAHRAGVRIENTEYVQFHPTTLAVPGARNFLISEAVRGAGAKLFTPSGDRFMERYSPEWMELAPRDVVSRAMHHTMAEHGYPHLLLDLSSIPNKEGIQTRFPTIHSTCASVGIDICHEPIPVVPAAHYTCGGILVDSCGQTNMPGLYAVGEVSCTGIHGANRLASTSLLEGLVWGTTAGEDIAAHSDVSSFDEKTIPEWQHASGDAIADPILIRRDVESVQNIMWHYVGLSRSKDRLKRAVEDLHHLWHQIDAFYRSTKLDDALIGLRNMVQCAQITAQAAIRNQISRGTHWREDDV
jgi:L-aspartate oxidase